jgi:hypothetical protein
MIRYKRVCIAFVPVALIALVALSARGDPVKIRSLRTAAYFSKSYSATPWNAYVLTPGGKRAYELSFEPEYGPKNEIIGLNLVLVDAQKKHEPSGSNLLDPRGIWHGLQPYDFMGRDLAQGPDKSILGTHRTLRIEDRKLVVRIDISSVKVSPLANGDYQIDQLDLAISVDKLSS